ncbi:DUF6194 family protein [Mycetocola miduiensis]|uniref:DUF6194 domain-containing protein n=1 Tax=Mycetocola miduiensis TaxID=995034 RepID=A0A1I5DN69_9MICO|nr:DUF6194 family protein [Mycetocola miduiensis]SFO00725.1 hypothetical protein SAMN05216219_3004 [Mycetocola miduiensis]
MSAEALLAFGRTLPGVVVDTVGAGSAAPEIAWGDSFFYYDPDDDERNRMHPFATIATKDYTGFDEASDLDRPGIFRLNIAVGRAAFRDLLGFEPDQLQTHTGGFDYTRLDLLLPHPIYAAQGWVAILNPGERTLETVKTLIAGARDLAAKRYDRRASR